MPVIRFIHPPDIREHGEGPVVVEDVQARFLTDARRAVLLTEADLEELKKDELVELAEEISAVEVSKREPKKQIARAIADEVKAPADQ